MDEKHVEALDALCIEETPLARLTYKAVVLIQYAPVPRDIREKYTEKIGEVALAVMLGKLSEKKAMRKVRGIYGAFKGWMHKYLSPRVYIRKEGETNG